MSGKDVDTKAAPPSADDLRLALLKREMEKLDQEKKKKEIEQKRLADFAAEFIGNRVSEEEIAMVRRLVKNAVEDGKFEAMVYSFPSVLCTDGGRAINSAGANWPETLQGKAREFYERFEQFGRPAGYKLKAMIINFPDGVPGDVGFFLNWAPDRV